jgi:error-prone DNA polymerase
MHQFEFVDPAETLAGHLRESGLEGADARYQEYARLWCEMQDLPRHLGQHSGGMVICQGRLDEVVPLENASMPGRVVVQWDKDDCADLGIVKVDVLGLGMMAVLEDAIRIINGPAAGSAGGAGAAAVEAAPVDLAHLPPDDPLVYDMLQRADTLGVFQVESRAQMATLPRLRPRCFYDLVVEVAIIRPGPIVGRMVHPYLARRSGEQAVSYPHPLLEPVLARTLGVPLFQEQLLRMAMVVAGFSGGEAEELRRAMGFKRSVKRMQQIETRLRTGMAARGITGEAADGIVQSITSFALYGFPESHAASFALLVYASAYLKAHYPAAFYTALLNNQPMGFYHPATLVKDAQRHGVRFAPIDVQISEWACAVQEDGAIRLGLRYVKGLREEAGQAIERRRGAPRFASIDALVAEAGLRQDEVRGLAAIGALAGFGGDRRAALWQAERAGRPAGPLLMDTDEPGAESDASDRSPGPSGPGKGPHSSPLAPMTPPERAQADYDGTGLTIGPHPMALVRPSLATRGVARAIDLTHGRPGRRVRVAGAVITRQRPGTAKGFVFLSLEDETGIANIIVSPDIFAADKAAIVGASYLLVEGRLQNQSGAVSVKAERVESLAARGPEIASHDFH